LALLTKSGAARSPLGKSGLAALTTRLLTESTQNKDALALAQAVENLGTEFDYDTSRESSGVGLECLPEDLDAALDLLAEVVLTPSFRPADFERVKKQWLDELQAERQNPSQLASLIGVSTVLGPRFGAPVKGRPKEVEGLRRQDLVSFHRTNYRPHNAALVVVGPIKSEAVLAAAKKHLYAWRGKVPEEKSESQFPEAPEEFSVQLLDRPGSVQSAIFAAHRAPVRSDKGYEARTLMNTLFGGLFTSRLNLNLREEHAFTYGAGSFVVAGREYGLFGLSTSVHTEVTADAVEQIVKELDALTKIPGGKPITEVELSAARADETQSLFAKLEHVNYVASALESLFIYDLPTSYLSDYPSTLAGISLAEVQAATATVKKNQLNVIVVGDKSLVEAPLRALGIKVQLLDPALAD
jgi:zinc protease